MLRRLTSRVRRLFEKKYPGDQITHANAIAYFERRRHVYDELIESILPYVPREGLIMDVGANIGYFSKRLADRIGFSGQLFLFEPVPNLASLCAMTFAGSRYEARVFPFGLGDEDGEFDIYVDQSGEIGWNTLVAERQTANMKPVRVAIRRFDPALISSEPGFIKIDVEGSEYRVLRGLLAAFNTWKSRPPILVEIGWGESSPHWAEELEVLDELASLGYRAVGLNGHPIDVRAIKATTDVVFLHDGGSARHH